MKIRNTKRAVAVVRNGFYRKSAVAMTALMFSPFAFATTGDALPADLDAAPAWIREKGLAALAIAGLFTLIYLGIKGAKVPRRA